MKHVFGVKLAFTCLLFAMASGAIAQDSLGTSMDTIKIQVPVLPVKEEDRGAEPEGSEAFVVVESMPEFPGGEKAMMKYIAKRVKYPAQARKDNIEGKVMVQFVVSKTGAIQDVKVINNANPVLAKAAIKVIEEMPKWSPGMARGEPIAVRYVVPITFKLND